MDRMLAGRSILIVEDEPLIAMELTQAFERAGARVMMTRSLREALRVVDSDGLSAAVLDHALGDAPSGTAAR